MAPRRTRTLRQQEARAGLGLVAALVVRKPFKGRTLVRASMLLPYVAPVVAVTFVWEVMLHPELGIVNALGADLLGWKDPIPFLDQRTGTLSGRRPRSAARSRW